MDIHLGLMFDVGQSLKGHRNRVTTYILGELLGLRVDMSRKHHLGES